MIIVVVVMRVICLRNAIRFDTISYFLEVSKLETNTSLCDQNLS